MKGRGPFYKGDSGLIVRDRAWPVFRDDGPESNSKKQCQFPSWNFWMVGEIVIRKNNADLGGFTFWFRSDVSTMAWQTRLAEVSNLERGTGQLHSLQGDRRSGRFPEKAVTEKISSARRASLDQTGCHPVLH
jgi:hypothetical protein